MYSKYSLAELNTDCKLFAYQWSVFYTQKAGINVILFCRITVGLKIEYSDLQQLYLLPTTSASTFKMTILLSLSLVYTEMDFFNISLLKPVFRVTSIFPSPPAGISFCERRTPVQPHPAFTLSIVNVDEPVFLKVKICFNSAFCLTCPKLYLSSLNSMRGLAKHDINKNNKKKDMYKIIFFRYIN